MRTRGRWRSRARSVTSSGALRRRRSWRPGWPATGEFRYYGTADATAWFLVVLEASGEPGLEPARRAAADWLARSLDRGGGLLRHAPGTLPGGLLMQGWRDSIDPAGDAGGGGYVRADGSNPAAAAGRRRHAGGLRRGAAGAGADDRRPRMDAAARGAARAAERDASARR